MLGSSCKSLQALKQKAKFQFDNYKWAYKKKLFNCGLGYAQRMDDIKNFIYFIELGASDFAAQMIYNASDEGNIKILTFVVKNYLQQFVEKFNCKKEHILTDALESAAKAKKTDAFLFLLQNGAVPREVICTIDIPAHDCDMFCSALGHTNVAYLKYNQERDEYSRKQLKRQKIN